MRYSEASPQYRNDGLRASQQRGSHEATTIVGEPGGGPHGAAKRRDGPDERRVAKVRKPGGGERCNGGTIDVRRRARAARGGAGGRSDADGAGRDVELPRNSKTVRAPTKARRWARRRSSERAGAAEGASGPAA